MGIFLKFDGLGLQGEATDKNHQGWIELTSYSLGGFQRPPGVVSGNDSSKPVAKEINCTKRVDGLSAQLFQFAVTAKLIPAAVIDNTKEHGDMAQNTFLRIELKDVIISSYQPRGASGEHRDTPLEGFALNFADIDMTMNYPINPPDSP